MLNRISGGCFLSKWTQFLALLIVFLIGMAVTGTQASPIWPGSEQRIGYVYRIIPASELIDSASMLNVNRLMKRSANAKREKIIMDAMDGYLI